MKRDNDLLRSMLLEFGADDSDLIFDEIETGQSQAEQKRQHHLELLCDQGFMTQVSDTAYRLTSQGHDFIEAIRDDGVWNKTKRAVAETGGNATLEITKAIATGFLKEKLSKHTGIEF